MRIRTAAVVALLVLVSGTAGAVWLVDQVLGQTPAASGPMTPVPLATRTPAPAATATTAAMPAATPAATPAASSPEPTPAPDSAASGPRLFHISPDETTVQFTIYEELSGQPQDVVGTTNQIAGELAVDFADASSAQVGVIQINARTFVTDNSRRDGAIRNFILNTAAYEYITFTPTELIGLSGPVAPGTTAKFQLAGDLTIGAVTRPVVFDVSVDVVSADRLDGTASATIRRSDFNLSIPSVPRVANVGDDIRLQINGVAVAVP
jgi:polyisoprenoid-binding protein YceI